MPITDRQSTIDNTPVAAVASRAGVLRIVHVNRAACDLRIRPGQALADARAIAPALNVCEDDPAADRRRLESLALWADGLSPLVHIEGNDTLFLDVTGCSRLFGGERPLLDRAIRGVGDQGFTVRAALADTPGGAWALAHAHRAGAVLSEPGQLAADLVPLPVWSLRIAARTVDALASVGVETIASLLYLPRASLAARFDADLPTRIDQALGNIPEPLTSYRPRPVLVTRFPFGVPTDRTEVFREALRRALQRFCEKLVERAAGVCRLFVTFRCPDVPADEGTQNRTVTLPVHLCRPTRSAAHLDSLLNVLLDNLCLPGPADALTVWTRELERFAHRQEELFSTGADDGKALADLVDRLTVRLGRGRVVAPELLDEHLPERAFRYVPLSLRSSAAGSAGNSPPYGSAVEPPSRCGSAGASPSRVGVGQSPTYVPSSLRRSVASSLSSLDPPLPQSLDPSSLAPCAAACPRPIRLLAHPLEVVATAVVPDGPPVAFHSQGTRHEVARRVGPERIETGWWRGPHLKRDYYRVTTVAGRRVWLFRNRDTGKWFLHGWFD